MAPASLRWKVSLMAWPASRITATTEAFSRPVSQGSGGGGGVQLYGTHGVSADHHQSMASDQRPSNCIHSSRKPGRSGDLFCRRFGPWGIRRGPSPRTSHVRGDVHVQHTTVPDRGDVAVEDPGSVGVPDPGAPCDVAGTSPRVPEPVGGAAVGVALRRQRWVKWMEKGGLSCKLR